jgi:hypothetical protein
LTGIAVNVTLLPSQTGFEDALMEIPTGRLGATVISIGFELAGLPSGHFMLEFIWQVTMLLLAGTIV